MPFKIVRNDITKMKVDAIVNTANPQVRVGRGVDTAIYNAAGWDRLIKEREKIGPMRRGSAAITPGFDLPAKYIIHTVGPRWDEDEPELCRKLLRDCYDNSMSLALEHGVKSIAFPLISTGSYSFPKEVGLDIAFTTISKYLYTTDMDVYLVVYDDEAVALSKKLMDDIDEFIDSHYVEEAAKAAPSYYQSYRSGPAAMDLPSAGASKQVPRRKKSFFKSIIPSKGSKAVREFREEEKLPEKEELSYSMPSFQGTGQFDAIHIDTSEEAGESSQADPTAVFKEYRSIDELLAQHKGETFQDRLFRYLDKSGMSDVEVYKGANLSKQTFSKIKQPGHVPKKKTIMALAISMKLSVDETRDLLESAGQAFSPSSQVDLVIQYCMYNGIYNMFDVERILFEKFGETLVS